MRAAIYLAGLAIGDLLINAPPSVDVVLFIFLIVFFFMDIYALSKL